MRQRDSSLPCIPLHVLSLCVVRSALPALCACLRPSHCFSPMGGSCPHTLCVLHGDVWCVKECLHLEREAFFILLKDFFN